MKADLEFYATEPDIIMTPHKMDQVIIRSRIVEQTDKGPQRTNKILDLHMSLEQAMRLLLTLQGVHRGLKLPPLAEPPSMISVPPAKQRN